MKLTTLPPDFKWQDCETKEERLDALLAAAAGVYNEAFRSSIRKKHVDTRPEMATKARYRFLNRELKTKVFTPTMDANQADRLIRARVQ